MKLKYIYYSLLTIAFLSFIKCGIDQENADDLIGEITIDNEIAGSEHLAKVKKIFINIPSPIEMAVLMQKANSEYNGEVLNSPDKIEEYNTVKNIALNLGIYGADLSYTRIFDQIQESVSYLSSIKTLSDGLGIPQDEGSFAVQRIEENLENKDSLLLIITDTYTNADTYLKENDRGSTATLIILGGWIEALYIATHVVDLENPNKEILNRIAEQKFSLENLTELVTMYKEDPNLDSFIPELAKLQVVFDEIEIDMEIDEVITDTVNQTTIINSKASINVTLKQVKKIKEVIASIRSEITNS